MKKVTKILSLSLVALSLFACDDILAKPDVVVNEDSLITIGDNKNIYNNNFDVIYDQLVSSGTSNSTIMKEIINNTAKKEISKFYNISEDEFNKVLETVKAKLVNPSTASLTGKSKELEDIILEKVKKTMMDKVKSGSYSKESLYQEEKFANELKTSLYNIKGDVFVEDYLITPDSKYENLFKADYSDYVERSIYPDLLKELLTSIYLYENQYLSLGRAYAREVKYIKLETISTHKDSVPMLINSYFEAFIKNEISFDLDSLAKIYKGVNLSSDSIEKTFLTNNPGITTRENVIEEEINKVGVWNASKNEYDLIKDSTKRDNELVSSYTGSYSYPVSHGKILKDRELEALDIVVDDGLVVKSGGVSNLPSDLRDRIFTSNISNNITKLASNNKQNEIQILIPKYTPNLSESDPDYYLNKYAYYDTSSNAYYIVLIGNYYNTSALRQKDDDSAAEKEEKQKHALEIARLLSSTSSNQTDAITHYLNKYDLTFGDQKFYDYLKETYPDLDIFD